MCNPDRLSPDGTAYYDKIETMSKLVVAPLPGDVFKPDIFKGKVLFCTGGGSGIGKAMTEAVVSNPPPVQPSLSSFGRYVDASWG